MARARITKATQAKAARDERRQAKSTRDGFVNFGLNLGVGTNNALSESSYGFNPITRNRTLLEWIHRGSWLAGVAIDLVAEDMTRAGIEIQTQLKPEDLEQIQRGMTELGIWDGTNSLNAGIKWGRLYGGAIAIHLIDGQRMETPLNLNRVGKGQYRGLLVLDRWMVEPDLTNLVSEMGPDLGKPMYYRVTADAPALPRLTVHYSRVIRFEGIQLPYWQRVQENLWGESILERLYDRLLAFDSATMGAAQLIYKSYIRTYKVDGMRDLLQDGGPGATILANYTETMRKYQGLEGVTLIDSKDDFVPHQIGSIAGIADGLVQFGQQISGALQVPLVRLFGQSPAGLNSTGESDLRTYYDGIAKAQERDMRRGTDQAIRLTALSRRVRLPDDFSFVFRPLWQLTEDQKSQVYQRDAQTVADLEERGLYTLPVALRELRQLSRVTGRGSNITDEMIEEAEDAAPDYRDRLEQEAEAREAGAALAPGQGGEPGEKQDFPSPKPPKGNSARSSIEPRDPQDRRTIDGLPRTEVMGQQIAIECPAGSARWSGGAALPADYGYIRRVPSAEGPEEWMDCFVGPGGPWAFVYDQTRAGRFDEHKVMLAYPDEQTASLHLMKTYGGMGVRHNDCRRMDEAQLAEWLATADVTRPAVARLRAVR